MSSAIMRSVQDGDERTSTATGFGNRVNARRSPSAKAAILRFNRFRVASSIGVRLLRSRSTRVQRVRRASTGRKQTAFVPYTVR